MLPKSPFLRRVLAVLSLGLVSSAFAASSRPQQQSQVSSRGSDRVEALLAQMTLEEKAGQLSISGLGQHGAFMTPNPEIGSHTEGEMVRLLREGLISSFYGEPEALKGRTIQRVAVEESRLGIPVLFASDITSGSKTVFPVPLGEAASFEPELARRTARAGAIEASTIMGVHWNYGPIADLARDQRWGRVIEGAGEDPVLTSAFVAARVRGHQGDDITDPTSLITAVKHFGAYGASHAGLDYAQVDISPQTLRDVHLTGFKAAVDAGALAIMASFNDINGVPVTGSHLLLTQILREEWGFDGVVIGDANSDIELVAHGYAEDERDATRKAIMAGLDMPLMSGSYRKYLPDLVRSGLVPEERVDEAVRRVLTLKEKVGLLDNPYRSLDPERAANLSYIAEHDALAREAARRSIVLLKNEDKVLPLRKHGQRIALVGPFAQDLENISGLWGPGVSARFISLEAGVRAAMADDSLLEVVPGVVIAEAEKEIVQEGGIAAAVAAARRADVVLLAVGEPRKYSGEARSRVGITLPPAQQALAEAVAATGKPIIVLLRNGRALALEGAVRDAQAIAVTWYLGTQNGNAIADVLFGDYNPSAKLPVSFPIHSGQQPYFYNHPRSGREQQGDRIFRTRWREIPHSPLYAFGHGLSYTTFGYGIPRLSTEQLGWDQELRVTTTITNTGKVFGEEVVQLYIHDRVASRVRPVRELKKFTKIGLMPGESQQVVFSLSRHDLEFTTADGEFTAEPGLFDLWVSSASDTGTPVQFELLSPPKK